MVPTIFTNSRTDDTSGETPDDPEAVKPADPLKAGIETVEEDIKDIIHTAAEVGSEIIEGVKEIFGGGNKGNLTATADASAERNGTANGNETAKANQTEEAFVQRRAFRYLA
jgi:hypothetical protein